LMIDGSGSLGCRILGRLRPVRIVTKCGLGGRLSWRGSPRSSAIHIQLLTLRQHEPSGPEGDAVPVYVKGPVPSPGPASAVVSVFDPSCPNLFVFRIAKCNFRPMHDLEEMVEKLLKAARKLPPGPIRHDILKEIGRFRVRLAALRAQSEQLQT
jgi:hypothetical protein